MELIKKLFQGDRIIWIIFMLFCLISLIEVFSASSTLTYKSGDHWRPITSHFILLLTGTVVVFVVHIIPCRLFGKAIALLPVSWLLLIAVFIIGALTNGARRWIDLGFFQFQPSELAKMAVIISVAYILSRFQTEDGADKKAFKYILMVTGGTVFLIITENLSTAVLLATTVYIMMFIGRVPLKQMLKLGGAGVLAIILAVSSVKYIPDTAWDAVGLHRATTWKNRLNNHIDQSQVPAAKFDIDNDAQVAHANIAIATSNILGKGPGNSVQRDFLSQAFSDFIYAIIIEELGLVGGAFVALLYIVLLMRIGKIARGCDKSYYAFLIMGIGVLLSVQAMFNMLVAVGIMPVTGQPLPLISKGGTSIIVNSAYIGMILSVSRHVYKTQQQEEEDEALKQQQIKDAAVTILQNAAVQLAQKDLGTYNNSSDANKNNVSNGNDAINDDESEDDLNDNKMNEGKTGDNDNGLK